MDKNISDIAPMVKSMEETIVELIEGQFMSITLP